MRLVLRHQQTEQTMIFLSEKKPVFSEFIFIDGQKTITKDNTTTIKSTAKKSNEFVMRLCASTN